MRIDTLDLLRCPYCGGRLELVTSMFHRATAEDIQHGILGCHCCIFPVIDGIPVFHLQPEAIAARGEIEAGRPDRALHVMVGLDGPEQAATFEATIASPTATYKEAVEALGRDTTLEECACIGTRRSVTLHEDLVAATGMLWAAEEVIETHFIQ